MFTVSASFTTVNFLQQIVSRLQNGNVIPNKYQNGESTKAQFQFHAYKQVLIFDYRDSILKNKSQNSHTTRN